MPRIRYTAVNGPPKNPILQLLGLVIGLGTLAIAFVFGAFLLAAFLGLGLVAALFVYLRVWWLRRKMPDAGMGPRRPSAQRQGDVIETEYSVVDRSSSKDAADE